MRTFNAAPFCHRGWHSYKCHYTYPVAYFQGCATSINSWGPMDDIFVTQPFTARHVRFTKKLGFGSLGNFFGGVYVSLICRFRVCAICLCIDSLENVSKLISYNWGISHIDYDRFTYISQNQEIRVSMIKRIRWTETTCHVSFGITTNNC